MRRRLAALVVLVVLADTVAAADVLNDDAEKNAPRVTEAGDKATPDKAVAGGRPNSKSSSNPKRTEEQGWLLSIAEQLPNVADRKRKRKGLIGTVIHSTRGVEWGPKARKNAKADDLSWHFTVDRDGKIYQHLSLNSWGAHAGHSKLVLDGKTFEYLNDWTIGIELTNLGGTIQVLDVGDRTKWAWRNWVEPKWTKECTLDEPAKLSKTNIPVSASLGSRMALAGQQLVYQDATGTAVSVDAYWEEYSPAQIDGLIRLLRAIEQSTWYPAVGVLVAHSMIATCPEGRKIDPGPRFPWDKLQGFKYLQ